MNRWIKVIDQMPPPKTLVLLTDGDEVGVGTFVREYGALEWVRPELDAEGEAALGPVWITPTYWMKLPELPK